MRRFIDKDTKTKKAEEIIEKNFGKILKEGLIELVAEETGIKRKSAEVIYLAMERGLIAKIGQRNRKQREAMKAMEIREITTYKGRQREKFIFDDSKLYSFGCN